MKIVSRSIISLFAVLTFALVLSACGKDDDKSTATPTPIPTFDPGMTPAPTPAQQVQGINLFTKVCNPTCFAASKEITVDMFFDDGAGGYYFPLTFSGPVKTDATGRLRIGLEAGKYRLSPKVAGAGTPAPVEVTIPADTYINVTLQWAN